MAKLECKTTFSRDVSAQEVAALFCNLFDHEQADFWDEVHRITSGWPLGTEFQWQKMRNKMRPKGLSAFKDMAQYAYDE